MKRGASRDSGERRQSDLHANVLIDPPRDASNRGRSIPIPNKALPKPQMAQRADEDGDARAADKKFVAMDFAQQVWEIFQEAIHRAGSKFGYFAFP